MCKPNKKLSWKTLRFLSAYHVKRDISAMIKIFFKRKASDSACDDQDNNQQPQPGPSEKKSSKSESVSPDAADIKSPPQQHAYTATLKMRAASGGSTGISEEEERVTGEKDEADTKSGPLINKDGYKSLISTGFDYSSRESHVLGEYNEAYEELSGRSKRVYAEGITQEKDDFDTKSGARINKDGYKSLLSAADDHSSRESHVLGEYNEAYEELSGRSKRVYAEGITQEKDDFDTKSGARINKDGYKFLLSAADDHSSRESHVLGEYNEAYEELSGRSKRVYAEGITQEKDDFGTKSGARINKDGYKSLLSAADDHSSRESHVLGEYNEAYEELSGRSKRVYAEGITQEKDDFDTKSGARINKDGYKSSLSTANDDSSRESYDLGEKKKRVAFDEMYGEGENTSPETDCLSSNIQNNSRSFSNNDSKEYFRLKEKSLANHNLRRHPKNESDPNCFQYCVHPTQKHDWETHDGNKKLIYDYAASRTGSLLKYDEDRKQYITIGTIPHIGDGFSIVCGHSLKDMLIYGEPIQEKFAACFQSRKGTQAGGHVVQYWFEPKVYASDIFLDYVLLKMSCKKGEQYPPCFSMYRKHNGTANQEYPVYIGAYQSHPEHAYGKFEVDADAIKLSQNTISEESISGLKKKWKDTFEKEMEQLGKIDPFFHLKETEYLSSHYPDTNIPVLSSLIFGASGGFGLSYTPQVGIPTVEFLYRGGFPLFHYVSYFLSRFEERYHKNLLAIQRGFSPCWEFEDSVPVDAIMEDIKKKTDSSISIPFLSQE